MMTNGIFRKLLDTIFGHHPRAHEIHAHSDVRPEFEREFAKKMAEERRADIQRRLHALEVMYESQARTHERES